MAAMSDSSGRIGDEELVARALEGTSANDVYLEHLLGRYRAWILRRCLAIVGDPDDAEDATQEVMLRVYRGLEGFQGRSSFRTWLYAIIQRECWTFAARRERLSIPDEIRIEMQLQFDTERHVQVAPISPRQMSGVLSKMPRPSREVLQLRFLRELSLPQIAVLLGVSLSATKMRLYRALSLGQHLMDSMTTGSRNA